MIQRGRMHDRCLWAALWLLGICHVALSLFAPLFLHPCLLGALGDHAVCAGSEMVLQFYVPELVRRTGLAQNTSAMSIGKEPYQAQWQLPTQCQPYSTDQIGRPRCPECADDCSGCQPQYEGGLQRVPVAIPCPECN